MHGRVVDHVVGPRDLHLYFEPERTFTYPLGDLLEEIARTFRARRRIVQMSAPSLWDDAKAPETARPSRVRKAHRRHPEVRLRGEAHRSRLRRLHEGESRRMTLQERFQRRSREMRRIARPHRAQKIQELGAGAGGKTVRRVAHD